MSRNTEGEREGGEADRKPCFTVPGEALKRDLKNNMRGRGKERRIP